MEKTTQNKFTKRLAQYGALSVAIAGVADANGQIIYTDVNPDEGGVGVTSVIDLDGDTNFDFLVTRNVQGTTGVINALFVAPADGNAIIASTFSSVSAGPYNYPFALDEGVVISAGNASWNSAYAYQSMNWGSCDFSGSNWCGVTDKYLGLRFVVGADTFYGWARLDVTNASNWLLKDYAYNSTPGAAINAGQTTLSIEESNINAVRVVSLNKSIALYNLPENTSYRLFSTSGQSVLNGNTNGSSYVIEAASAATGIYILELNDTATNSVVRKKIVL